MNISEENSTPDSWAFRLRAAIESARITFQRRAETAAKGLPTRSVKAAAHELALAEGELAAYLARAASCVSSRHVLTEGYLIVYTDGTYLLCMWTDAP